MTRPRTDAFAPVGAKFDKIAPLRGGQINGDISAGNRIGSVWREKNVADHIGQYRNVREIRADRNRRRVKSRAVIHYHDDFTGRVRTDEGESVIVLRLRHRQIARQKRRIIAGSQRRVNRAAVCRASCRSSGRSHQPDRRCFACRLRPPTNTECGNTDHRLKRRCCWCRCC